MIRHVNSGSKKKIVFQVLKGQTSKHYSSTNTSYLFGIYIFKIMEHENIGIGD